MKVKNNFLSSTDWNYNEVGLSVNFGLFNTEEKAKKFGNSVKSLILQKNGLCLIDKENNEHKLDNDNIVIYTVTKELPPHVDISSKSEVNKILKKDENGELTFNEAYSTVFPDDYKAIDITFEKLYEILKESYNKESFVFDCLSYGAYKIKDFKAEYKFHILPMFRKNYLYLQVRDFDKVEIQINNLKYPNLKPLFDRCYHSKIEVSNEFNIFSTDSDINASNYNIVVDDVLECLKNETIEEQSITLKPSSNFKTPDSLATLQLILNQKPQK